MMADNLTILNGTAAGCIGASALESLTRRHAADAHGNNSLGRMEAPASLGVLALDIDKTNPMKERYPAAYIDVPPLPFSAIKTAAGSYPAAADIATMLLPSDGANGVGGNAYPGMGNLVARLAQDSIKAYLWQQCRALSAQGCIYVVASPSSTIGHGVTLETLCLLQETLQALGKTSVSKILVILSNQDLTMDPQKRLREAAFMSALNALERGGVMARPHTTGREHRGSLCDLVFFVSTACGPGLSPRSMYGEPCSIGRTVEELLAYEARYLEYCVASPVGAKVRADRIRTPLQRRFIQGQPPFLSFRGFSAFDARVDAVRRFAELSRALKVLDALRGTETQPAVLLAPPPPCSLAEDLLQRFVAPYREEVSRRRQEMKALLEETGKSPKDWRAPLQEACAKMTTQLQQVEREASAIGERLLRQEFEPQLRTEISLNNANAGSSATRRGLHHLRQALLAAPKDLRDLLEAVPPLEQLEEGILEQCRGTFGRDRKRHRVEELWSKLSQVTRVAEQKVAPAVQQLINELLKMLERLSESASLDAALEQAQQLCRQDLQALADAQAGYPVRFALAGSQLAPYSVPYVSTVQDEEVKKAFWRAGQPTEPAEVLYQRILASIRAQQRVMIDPDQLFETIYRDLYRSPSDRDRLIDELFAECRLAGEGVSPEFRAQHGPLVDIVTICCPPGVQDDLDAYLAKNLPNQDGLTLHTIPGLGQIVLHRESHRCPAFAQHHLRVIGEDYAAVMDKTPYVIAEWAAQAGSYLPREPHVPFQGFSAEELLLTGVCLGEFDPANITYPDPLLVETHVSLGPLKDAIGQVTDDGHRQHIVQFLTTRLLVGTTAAEITARFNDAIKKGVQIDNVAVLHRKVVNEWAHLQANGAGSSS